MRNHSIFEEDDEERRLRRLREFVAGLGATATLRDVTHGPRVYRGAQGADRARGDLDELVRRGVLERTQRNPGPSGGRPTSTYRPRSEA